MNDQPTPYAELADVTTNLPLLLREARRARGLSMRTAADQLGMSFSTVQRIEIGQDCVLSNAVAVLRWLDQTPARLAGQNDTDVVHLIRDGSATTSCCHRTPFELPRAGGHRLTVDSDQVTCGLVRPGQNDTEVP